MAENMIKFLRGNVAEMKQTAIAGAVYFTKDEGLYLGLEDGTYHRYGDFITVADVASLPATGAHEKCMYYCIKENILAKWDKESTKWIQINQQKTLEQLGGVAKSVYDAKMTLLEQADDDNAEAISDLETYVGTIPTDATATNVVAYVQEKTAGIATNANLEALAGRVDTAEGKITTIETSLADGGATANAIATAKAAGDAAQADVDALEIKVGTVEDGKTVVGLIGTAQAQADKGVADAATAKARADEAYNLANGKATMTEVNEAIAGAGHAVKTEVDTAIENLDKAYKAADSALETKLQGNIDKKVAQTDYDTKVAALEAKDKALGDEDARLAGLIAGNTEAIEDNADAIAAVKADVDAFFADADLTAQAKDTLKEIQEYINSDATAAAEMTASIQKNAQDITALDTKIGAAADGETDATGLYKVIADGDAALQADIDKLAQDDIDNLAAAKKYTDDEIAELNIAQYAKQSDLDAHTGDTVAHITADERTKWNASEGNAKTYADGLNTAMNARVEALEAIDHEHANKAELDLIASGDVAKWNGAQDAAEATAAAALAGAKTELEGKITAEANTARAAEKANADAIAVINGTGDGSFAKADAALKTELQTYADTAESDAVATSKAYTDTALTWGEF